MSFLKNNLPNKLPSKVYDFRNGNIPPSILVSNAAGFVQKKNGILARAANVPELTEHPAKVGTGLTIQPPSGNYLPYSTPPTGFSQPGSYTFTAITDTPVKGMPAVVMRANNHPTDNHNQLTTSLPALHTYGVSYVFSCYVKQVPGNTRLVSLLLAGNHGPTNLSRGFATFTLGDEFGNGGSVSYEHQDHMTSDPMSHMEYVGNGWYRIWVSVIPKNLGTTQFNPTVHVYVGSNVNQNNSMALNIAGMQVEYGSAPSAPMLTSGSQVTRPAQSVYANDTFNSGSFIVTISGDEFARTSYVNRVIGIGNGSHGISLAFERSSVDNRHGWLRLSYSKDNVIVVGFPVICEFVKNGDISVGFSIDLENNTITYVSSVESRVLNLSSINAIMKKQRFEGITFGTSFNVADAPANTFGGMLRNIKHYNECFDVNVLNKLIKMAMWNK